MVDVDRSGSFHYTAGLRRLSARAAAPSAAVPSPRSGLVSFSPLADALSAQLRFVGVPLLPGLSAVELARAEAELGFVFPPDLRALLSFALPSAPGFPDWRHPARLRLALRLPFAAASVHLARRSGHGGRARAVLREAPVLIPLFGRCYIPARPPLAGNPIFLVDERRIMCCAVDLADFFRRETLFLPPSSAAPLRRQLSAAEKIPPPPPQDSDTRRSLDSIAGKAPRWIEFWSEAAVVFDRRRRSSSSTSDAEQFLEIQVRRPPEWVQGYLDRICSVLREGGWPESEVAEMAEATSVIGFFDGETAAVTADCQGVLDALLLKADRCSDLLRRAGWGSDEVSEVLGFDLRPQSRRRRPLSLPPGLASKIVGKLAEVVAK